MPKSSPFAPPLFEFLADLGAHNDRKWFDKNKARYEAEVREPALEFIRRMAPHLAKISEHFLAVDNKVGGSLMRVHRDTRFGKDKTPYKTNVGIQFRHDAGKDVHAPGFYVHLEVSSCFLAAGMWRPEPEALAAIREAIAGDPAGYRRVRDGKPFRRLFAFEGESLLRPPKGYDADHPLIDDLRRKDHIAVHHIDAADVLSPDFVDTVAKKFKATAPFMRWLCAAVDVAF
ncbi:MAG: DUF2461 domain-containing protein [Planctomycetes bacterium]|nr:DUF2461 domain-containing protein [Planctomycetota bacterium]